MKTPTMTLKEDNVEGCREHIELEVDHAQGMHLVNIHGSGMCDTGVPRAARNRPVFATGENADTSAL